jgi:hypothetical protein
VIRATVALTLVGLFLGAAIIWPWLQATSEPHALEAMLRAHVLGFSAVTMGVVVAAAMLWQCGQHDGRRDMGCWLDRVPAMVFACVTVLVFLYQARVWDPIVFWLGVRSWHEIHAMFMLIPIPLCGLVVLLPADASDAQRLWHLTKEALGTALSARALRVCLLTSLQIRVLPAVADAVVPRGVGSWIGGSLILVAWVLLQRWRMGQDMFAISTLVTELAFALWLSMVADLPAGLVHCVVIRLSLDVCQAVRLDFLLEKSQVPPEFGAAPHGGAVFNGEQQTRVSNFIGGLVGQVAEAGLSMSPIPIPTNLRRYVVSRSCFRIHD